MEPEPARPVVSGVSDPDVRPLWSRLMRLFAPTASPAKWPVAISILGGTVVGDGIGAALGWGDSAILTGLAAALVAAAGASGPARLAVRLALLASLAGFVGIALGAITTGHPWWAAVTIAVAALLTSALAAAGERGVALGALGMTAYSVTAALGVLKHLGSGVSDLGVGLRVAVGCALGVAVVLAAGLVRDRVWYRDAEIPVVPAPWRAMWGSVRAFDEHARDGVRRALVLGVAMYLLQRNGSRDGLWMFLGALAVLLPPVKQAVFTAISRVVGTLIGVVVLELLALALSANVLLVCGLLALLPAIAYAKRYPVLAGGLMAIAMIIFAGAPAHAIDTWASHRLLDTLIGCSVALAAQYLLWPRDRPQADDGDDLSARGSARRPAPGGGRRGTA